MARKTKRLNAITDAELKLINPDNLELIEDFEEYLYSVDRSPKTIPKYRSDLNIVMNYFRLHLKNKKFIDIKKRDVIKFQKWCLDEGMSPARIRGLRSAMSSLSNYIENMLDDEYPTFRNIINKIEAPANVAVREKTVLSNEQIETLLQELVKKEEYQKACLLSILCASGMRISEVVQCKTSWFTGESVVLSPDGTMYVSEEIRTKGRGSQGKRLKKLIIKSIADEYLDLWIKQREELGIDTDDLFVRYIKSKKQYDPIKISTVSSWMNSFGNILGVNFYAHCVRHFAITWLKLNGVPVDKIRDFVGHNDSSTTEIYIDIDKQDNLTGMLDFM